MRERYQGFTGVFECIKRTEDYCTNMGSPGHTDSVEMCIQ